MLKKCFDLCRKNYSADFLKETTCTLNDLEKSCCFSSYLRSTDYVMEQMRKAGFTSVERIAIKADGVNEAFDAVMPQAWDVTGRCFLEVVGNVPDDMPQILADTDETQLAIATWSGATSENGDTGQIVLYDPDCIENMRGKWVFFDSMPRGNVTVPLVNAGILGVVTTDFAQGEADPDATRWLNGLGTYGWYYLKDEPHVPMFCLTARRAVPLKARLEKGEKITLYGIIKTRIYDGEIYTVTGIIPGKEEDEFALVGHLYEPFHNDNACGVAAAIEIGRMLNAAKITPKKTLRVIFSMEHYGLAQYYSQNLHTHKMFAALNIDCLIGYTYRELGDELHFRTSPCTVPFAGDLILEYLLRNCTPHLRWETGFGNLSDDTIGGDPQINIPTNWIYSKTNVFHHTNGRLFADVDWDMSKELVELLAAYTMFVITAEKQDLLQFKGDFEKLALAFLKNTDTPFARKVKCDFIAGQLISLNRICADTVNEKDTEEFISRFRIPDAEYTPVGDVETAASKVFVTHNQPGTPWSFAKVPYAEKRQFPYVPQPLHLALMNSKRSVLEAIKTYDVFNRNTMPQERIAVVLEYLEYLEKYGYISREIR